jgi:hypothetical protein
LVDSLKIGVSLNAIAAIIYGIFYLIFIMLFPEYIDELLSKMQTVFENQDLNIDNSGNGSKVLFEDNLKNLDRHAGSNTKIIMGDSTDSALNLVNTLGPGSMRYISIDGGHTAEHAINDLKIAEQLVANEGVVVLDDIMHYCWLGVIEGAVKYLSQHPTLVPFAIGQNKLWMCKWSYHKKYLELFKDSNLSRKWPQTFVGHEIVTM